MRFDEAIRSYDFIRNEDEPFLVQKKRSAGARSLFLSYMWMTSYSLGMIDEAF